MLEAIRKRSASLLVKLLFGLLILSFAAWGVGDMIRVAGGPPKAASVGDIDIPQDQLRSELNNEVNRLRQMTGGKIDIERLQAMGLANTVLQQIITRTLLNQGARDLGLSVGDAALRREINANANFHNTLGQFDPSIYRNVLSTSGLSEEGYVTMLRGDLTRNQLIDTIGVMDQAPQAMAVALFQARQEKRMVEIMRFGDDEAGDIPEPDKAALEAFHQDHAAAYTAPEYRAATVVYLDAKELAKEIAVSDDDLKAAYNERAGEYNVPEKRRLQQMVFADEATARTAHDLLIQGTDFAEVAKTVAGIEGKALELGLISRHEMLPELAEPAFGLPNGGFTPPIKSPLGWHILKTVSIQRARTKTLDEAREALVKVVSHDRAIDAVFDLSNRLEDALGGGSTLEEAAQTIGATARKIAQIDSRGLDPKGQKVTGLPAGQSFLPTLFQTPEGEESALTEAGNDGYFVVRTDGVTEPTLRPLDTVLAQVTRDWTAAQRTKISDDKAAKAAEMLKGPVDAAKVAADLGTEVVLSTAFTRDGKGAPADMPPAMVGPVFDLKAGETTTARGTGASFAARLKGIEPADPAANEEVVKRIARDLGPSLRNDLMVQYADAMRADYPVSINQRAVNDLSQ
ncbi:MAG: SurA N-terminal domain-containing protein [Rhodobacterales bacterium]|nr:SurA N-terminal domain-containing protein [Rhodobacterales bacterium]